MSDFSSRPFDHLRSMLSPESIRKEPGLPFGGKKKLARLKTPSQQNGVEQAKEQEAVRSPSLATEAQPSQPPARQRGSEDKKATGALRKPVRKSAPEAARTSCPGSGQKAGKQTASVRPPARTEQTTEAADEGLPVQKRTVRRNERGEIIRNPIPRLELMPGLPVSEHADELIAAIRDNQVIIVCGETGSGKTTQLPKLCLMAGRGRKGLIGHTQPRRIAASSVAKRIAEEMDSELGEVVGYKVRFTDETTPGASIKLMTDGILLAETQTDPMLRRYDTIIIDEAHERSINIDFLLGYLKRILARRRDFKVIVTSATIDSARFASHFGSDPDHPAPVFTISGRTYPVEIRYRALEDVDEEDDRTLMDAIADAADELEGEGRGDILVFLPGEREIREAAEVLRKRHRPGQVEILPLYARLSAQDQEKIFKSSGPRRIVLATNVAETSITVPGIRYVIDTGLARIKRYSYRNKVEQLLVEPVSQASANQRAGRCGRVANGICIRLFDENDWARRPAFTDPEIVRSNLAAVILRMKALKLGDVRAFPFVQPPPARAISDGYAILGELGAIDEAGELTETGRQLSRLPVDPRLSRMLLAAFQYGALREALIIVSGLAIQDPRERPLEAQEAADRAHKIFADEKSDFLSLMKIWNWYVDANANKQSNRLLTEQLKSRFLSSRRMREWRDVWRQLSELTREIGWSVNSAPATYEQLHRALLTGLLGNIGMRQLDADLRAAPFAGARGIRFWVWPGSGIAKKAGKWIVSAELVQTSRLFARTAADVEPEWIEAEGAHLIKKSWVEPHWEKSRGEVVALERGSLYGLTIYSGRRVGYARHDPALSRELFIRQALVAGDFDCRAPFFEHNMRLVREIRDIEHKARRPDVLIDEESIAEFYENKIPKDVVCAVTFEQWRKKAEEKDPKLLFMKRDELMRRDADGVTVEFFPKKIEMAGVTMALSYHFEPGSPRDGLTMAVPLFVLNQIDPVRCDWLVPGMLREKVQALIKSLPQRLRRHCVPIADYAMEFYRRVNGKPVPGKSVVDALIDDIREQTRAVCERTDFKLEFLPPHLTMNFKVIDEHGRQLAMGRNLSELRSELGGEAQKLFASMAQSVQSAQDSDTERITEWSFGELPELMEISRRGASLIGHPALVDRGEFCSLEVFDDPAQAARAHRAGLRRLFLLQMREQVRYLEKNLSGLQRVQMQASVIEPVAGAFESFESLRSEVVEAAVELSCLAEPWPTNADEFAARKDEGRSRLTLVGMELQRLLENVVSTLGPVPKKLAAIKGFPEAVRDIEGQMRELFPRHFLLEIPSEQLRHYPRYAKAIMIRLEKLRNDPERDRQAASDIARLAVPYRRELASRRGVVDPRLAQFRWLLEELRVSLFAQELRTPMPVSVKRLTRVWESLLRL